MQGKWLEYEDIVSIRVDIGIELKVMFKEMGRPQSKISMEQLLHLSSLDFTWREMCI